VDWLKESARTRAWRIFTGSLPGFWGGVWLILWTAGAAASSTWISSGHSGRAQAVIGFGFAVVGFAVAAFIWLLGSFAWAPVEQRNQARAFIEAELSVPRSVRWRAIAKRLGYQARGLVKDPDNLPIDECRRKHGQIADFLEASLGIWARYELQSRADPKDATFELNWQNNLSSAAALLDQLADKTASEEIAPDFPFAQWEASKSGPGGEPNA
jgi:hypothetical protein